MIDMKNIFNNAWNAKANNDRIRPEPPTTWAIPTTVIVTNPHQNAS
ncbi:hypothetical protein [Nostoc sp. LEGE 12450]|nr:hypothetical protein [Nostoc sp. LEGE 12450]MBE8992206.1 hypothetical protein [Nostoc sp. LEGE 12450]